MKLSLYVHDLHPQIGHSRALIELINGLTPEQKSQISSLEIVSFTSTSPEELFPEIKCKKIFTKVPGASLKPFLLKMAFYHLYTYLHATLFAQNRIKIGIGIASLNVDIANIQFVHEQWSHLFFSKRKLNPLSYIYKKILFSYFHLSEKFLFKKNNIKFIVIANFITHFLKKKFGTDSEQCILIPSAVNTKTFNFSSPSSDETWLNLIQHYPKLKILNPNEPIILFVGAFERKGLDLALEYVAKIPSAQFIIIGKPEGFQQWHWPTQIKCVHIPFTKRVHDFYDISDLFIFPTYYEPFGLVIIEAYAMGLDIIIPKDNVGASEVIPEMEGIYYYNQGHALPHWTPIKINREQKVKRRNDRINKLGNLTWEKNAQKFYELLIKYSV